jgi:hypothetical protein
MKKQRAGRAGAPLIRYVVAVMAILVVGLGLVATRSANAADHPDPRAGLTAADVDSPEKYAAYPRVREIYTMAAQIPQVLDGLYCHCDCSKHSNHRSLLTCFQDDHGAACDVCLTEAALAYDMTRQGKSLKEIRRAVDGLYNHSGHGH